MADEREKIRKGAEEIEGHSSGLVSETGADAENVDPQAREAVRKANAGADDESEIEGHRKLK